MNGPPLSKRKRLDKWRVEGSRESHDCVNPVRSCEELYFTEAKELRDKNMELIQLSIGMSVTYDLYTYSYDV